MWIALALADMCACVLSPGYWLAVNCRFTWEFLKSWSLLSSELVGSMC